MIIQMSLKRFSEYDEKVKTISQNGEIVCSFHNMEPK